MNISIRKLLLINLLIVITIMLFVSIIGNYWLNKKNIESYFDNLLVVTAEEYRAMFESYHEPAQLTKIQVQLNKISDNISQHAEKRLINPLAKTLINQLPIQIWSANNSLLLRSYEAPLESLAGQEEGLADKKVNGIQWRVFTIQLPDKIKIVVAQSYQSRNALLNEIALDDFYVLLATLLLAGLLIWIIIGNEFKSLERVAKQIADREPTHLEPVDIYQVPTEIKPVVDEINNLITRLKQTLEREKRFSADAAHELRTPLAILKTHAQVALKTSDPTERNHALQNLIQGVNRSAHIVQQLLTLNRLVPETRSIIDYENVKIAPLASSIIVQLVPIALEKRVDIALECSNDNITINGNSTALNILMRNLIDNAVRYIPEGGQIIVSITEDEDNVIFKVSDNGPGIPVELRARVFERFFRVLGNKSSGSGLGLAIVNQIASLHDATVTLSNNPLYNSGLVVTVLFAKKHSS